MDVDAHWVHMEKMSEADHLRVITIIPKVTSDDLTPDFVEYMQSAHIDEFSSRFAFVLLAVMHFFPQCIVYVDSDDDDFYARHPGLARDQDIHDVEPAKLEEYIRSVMGGRDARMVFHFTEMNVLIRLTGGLDDDPEFDKMLTSLVAAQGMFVETYKNIWN